MQSSKYSLFRILMLLGDLALINISLFSAYGILHEHLFRILKSDELRNYAIYINLSWMVISLFLHLYDLNKLDTFEVTIGRLVQSTILNALLVAVLTVFTNQFTVSYFLLAISFTIFFVSAFIWRGVIYTLNRLIRFPSATRPKAIILGASQNSMELYQILQQYHIYGYKIDGFFENEYNNGHQADVHYLGEIAKAKDYARNHEINEIYYALPLSDTQTLNEWISFCDDNLIRLRFVPDFQSLFNKRVTLEYYGTIPIMPLREEPLMNTFNRLVKRTFDVVFSLFVITFLLSWLMPLVSLLILLDSKGSIFYLQNRSGENYRIFKILKFRTMTTIDKDEDFVQAKKDDPRITRVGKWIRKFNIDELPQFFNVLIGDMSIVGPRPHPLKLNDEFKKIISKYMIRHFVKPGITGFAQVKGFRGETSDPVLMEKRILADNFYVENWSFLLDMKIIFLTGYNIIRGEEHAY